MVVLPEALVEILQLSEEHKLRDMRSGMVSLVQQQLMMLAMDVLEGAEDGMEDTLKGVILLVELVVPDISVG